MGNREVLYAPSPQYLLYLYSDELGNRIRVLRKAVLFNPMLVQLLYKIQGKLHPHLPSRSADTLEFL